MRDRGEKRTMMRERGYKMDRAKEKAARMRSLARAERKRVRRYPPPCLRHNVECLQCPDGPWPLAPVSSIRGFHTRLPQLPHPLHALFFIICSSPFLYRFSCDVGSMWAPDFDPKSLKMVLGRRPLTLFQKC